LVRGHLFLDQPVCTTEPDFTDISLVIHDARLGPVAPRAQLPGGDPLGEGNRHVGITDPPGDDPPVAETCTGTGDGPLDPDPSHAFAYPTARLLELWP
jgi:hypothetical protein